MKHLLSLILLTVIGASAFAQQSGYGGDGKASSGASVSSFIRLYETAPGASTTALAGGGAGNVDNGAHLVKVTCYTPGGQTTGGTASNSTTVADKTTNGKIAISSIPTCSGFATGRKVYMTAAGGSSYFLLSNGTIANNTATTLTADDSDATLTASTALPTSNTAIDTRFTFGQSNIGFGTTSPAPIAFWSPGRNITISDTTTNLPNLRFLSSGGDFSFAIDTTSAYFYLANAGFLRFYTGAVKQLDIGSSEAAFTVPVRQSGTPQTLTGSGAVNLTTYSTYLNTTGGGTDTLAAGSEGQYKFITMTVDAGDAVVTVTNLIGGTTITFNDVNDFVLLFYQNSKWCIIVNSGCAVA